MSNTARNPFDTELLRRRRARGRCGPEFLEQLAGEELLARLAEMRAPVAENRAALQSRAIGRMVVCGPPWLAGRARLFAPEAEVTRADWLAARPGAGAGDVVLDYAALPFAEGSVDVMLSLFDLAFVNALPEALLRMRRALKPGGALLAALPGGESLKELRAAWAAADEAHSGKAWPRVAPFVEVKQLGQLAQLAGFAKVITDVERFRLRYADALSLMQELKEAGWSNPLRRRAPAPVSRRLLALAAAHYELAHADPDGRVPATFELLYLSTLAPAENETAQACPAGG